MTRLVAVGLVVLGSLASAGVARAEEFGMLDGGGTITWSRFAIKQNGTFKEPGDDDRRRYLNLAHCECARANKGEEKEIQYELSLSVATNMNASGEFWVGTTCNDDTARMTMCRKLATPTIGDVDELLTPDKIELNLYDVINGVDTMAACKKAEGKALAWLLVDKDASNPIDYVTNQSIGEITTVPGVDTKPPEAVKDPTVSAGEKLIEISWETPEAAEYFYFQALCAKAEDDSAVFTGEAVKAPQYQTARTLCDADAKEFAFTNTPITIPGERNVSAPAQFLALDKAFICGDEPSGTATSIQIKDLENGVAYKVALLAMDDYGNVVGTFFTSTVTPQPVTDFWEDLNDRNSAIDGGCLLSTTYGDGNPLTQTLRAFRDDTLARTALGRWLIDAYYATLGRLAVESLPARIMAGILLAPLVAIALLWHLLTLPGLLVVLALPWLWRRRARLVQGRRLRLAAAAAVAAAVLAPGLASADDATPYWEDPSASERAELDVPGEVKWQAGIRVGPYIPDIDLQFPQNAVTGLGPYEAMFGDYFVNGTRHKKHVYQVMPMLDVDRIVWSRFGQIGVGGSIGYMQKTAPAYADMTSENDAMRERSTASKTTFRLIPLAATVTYRFTYLDDRWGIPIVPYVRGGLSYYMWWMKAPDGNLSKVCKEAGAMAPCEEDKAYGGTIGVQASAGLAIRAERIDSDAARSMRNSGIEHAGFYGEVFWGRVDGFGSETKLWVGDTTWFAGVNFEF